MPWDLDELEALAKAIGSPIPRDFITAVNWKLGLAFYHEKEAENAWNSLKNEKGNYDFGEGKAKDACFRSEAHVIACLQAVHSIGDVLGQIINAALLAGVFKEEKASLAAVHEHLTDTGKHAGVKSTLEGLVGTDDWRYVNAFVNTVKHRRLLGQRFNMTMSGAGVRFGILFREFEYKGTRYPETWADDATGTYKTNVARFQALVGEAINDALR